jgi:hypothetical protein
MGGSSGSGKHGEQGAAGSSASSGGSQNGENEHAGSAAAHHIAPVQTTTDPGPVQLALDSNAQALSVPPPQVNVLDDKPKKKWKEFFNWDRSIDILKVVVTLWVALLGSYVTMQFNERQHELNRIEAIAQLLPHISSTAKKNPNASPGSIEPDDMSRDGAIWAVFRTANNRTMLRDLAALFPLDIYRVVSSIAVAGELQHDPDAVVALQVSSEKLAAIYSMDPRKADLANRLYAQALKLKQRSADDDAPLQVVDLSSVMLGDDKPTGDQMASLVKSINDLADQHVKDSSPKKKGPESHWQAKQLYQRARQLGHANDDPQVMEQVIRSDLSLANLYVTEQLADDAYKYLKEGVILESRITGKSDWASVLKSLDKDGNGFADISELQAGVKMAQEKLQEILLHYRDAGAELKE